MKIQTAERNSGAEVTDQVIHQRHLVAYYAAAKRISGTVLEIGSGEGYGIRILAPYAGKYYAYDKYATPVDAENRNVIFKQTSIPPLTGMEDASVDFVVSFQVIEHIKNDHFFLKEVKRVLKPGGTLILTTPNKRMSLTRNPWHVREYDPPAMAERLQEFFPGAEILGVFGNEKVMKYHEANRVSVRKFTRFDILRMQYWLPRWILKIPYDIANRLNRRKLHRENTRLVSEVNQEDFSLAPVTDLCFDFFCVARKPGVTVHP